jgi:hypothetical protein
MRIFMVNNIVSIIKILELTNYRDNYNKQKQNA